MNRINKSSIACVALLVTVAFVCGQAARAASYRWNVTSGNWSTPASWTSTTPLNGPQATDSVNFCTSGDTTTSPTTINNTVDQNFTISNLSYTNASTTAAYNVTAIGTGITLTVTNNLKVGQQTGSGAYNTYAYMAGGGTLLITGGYVDVWQAATVSGPIAYLNLSGLTNFVFNPTGGTGGGILGINDNSSVTRLGGNLTLANGSNYINAFLNLGTATAAQAGAGGTLTLGPGTNIIYAGGVAIGECKNSFTLQANGGGLLMAGSSGGSSQTPITIGDNTGGGGSQGVTGQLLLNGCTVNINASTIFVGEQVAAGTTLSVAGIFDFDTGTVSATSIVMADNTAGGGTSGSTTGTVQVGPNGTLNVGTGGISLATRTAGSIATTGTLNIYNGVVNCSGPINGGTNGAVTAINFLGGGTLSMGGLVGAIAPVGTLNVATNTTLAFSLPSYTLTNAVANTVNWPAIDTGVTISITALPAGINPGVIFPLLTTTNFVGTLVSPVLSLPPGVQGNLSQSTFGTTNTVFVTITAGVGPGTGGVNHLLNPSFALTPLGTNWTGTGGASVLSSSSTYPNTSACAHDTRNIIPLFGSNVAKLTGSFITGGSTNTWSQSATMAAGSTITAGAFSYVAHEDMMSGVDSFYYEVDFLDANSNLITAYESSIVTNLECGEVAPFALDTWNLMAVTNQMQVTGGVNTGVIVGNVASIIQAPPHTATALFKAVFIQRNATDTGSVYFSGANLGLLGNPVAPTLSTVIPNLVTLCTNTTLTCTASSSETAINTVVVTATTTTLGGVVTNTISLTNNQGVLTVSGLGTSTASISMALATNTIYQSVIIKAIDADGLTVSSSTVSFDTLVPALVIEASDFNFTSGGTSGLFFDTPANGGLALYTNQVGAQGIDENKITRTNNQSYYRPLDATVIQAANPVAPSGTEQKFVTAANNGDNRDIEVAIAFDTVGDWQDYSRTFGTSGTYSAQPGSYPVWCYLATSGSGPQVGFFQVTNSPAATGQGTNAIGTFGGTTFSDNNFGKFVYAPLVDQFGNRVALTISSGVQTFRGLIANSDTPNVGFYMLVPVAPIYTPVLLNVNPTGPYDSTGQFTFTVGPEQGTPISTNGIGLVLNGVPVTSGLNFTAIGNGEWTVNYSIQSNEQYSVVINVTNMTGQTVTYSNSFDTFNINNFHWMAVDYDFSTNNGTSTGGSAGNGWTGGLFINNPVPTGDTNAPDDQGWQLITNSYLAYPTAFVPGADTLAGLGAVAQQSIDVYWLTNATQDIGGLTSNSIYRAASDVIPGDQINSGDGVGTQIATDPLTSNMLPEFIFARTNIFSGPFGTASGPDGAICEFNVGYFYTNDWLNYTRIYPTGTFNIWGRLAAGAGAFSGCTLSLVTSGVGTSNQTTQVLGTFSDPNPAGWQIYHWIQLEDTNGNPVYVQLNGQETLKLTAPTNATPSGGSLNPLLFMLAPAASPITPFNLSAALVGGNIRISIPTQIGHNYTLWYSSSLSSTSWSQVGSAIPGDGTVHIVSQSAAGQQGYYKVIGQ